MQSQAPEILRAIVPAAGLGAILLQEPPGLSIGKVKLANGEEVLGVLAEPILCEGQREITSFVALLKAPDNSI